jgi:S-adenosylmethionine:tRNA ribosyltransferase-isomerase
VTTTLSPRTHFRSAADLTATEPPERRGLARDEVRLLIAGASGLHHARFRDLADHLTPGDLVVVNTSRTLAAQVDGEIAAGPVVVHVATELDDGTWVIELRTPPAAAAPFLDGRTGQRVDLPGGRALRLVEPYPRPGSSPDGHGNRLWRAHGDGVAEVLARHGRPIAYGYLSGRWPLEDYQTVFAGGDRDHRSVDRHGSAEMPSAGRPFTGRVLARLAARGVRVAPITLHTGVSSQEAGEGPQAERFEVPAATARLVDSTRAEGGRVVAVGTTVTRALESAARPDGSVVARRGWTSLVVGPDHPVRVVRGLITGWHDPQASHLLLVESVAGAALAQQAYDAAIAARYRWHEFGDSCLLLP